MLKYFKLLAVSFTLTACANQNMQGLSSLLGSTGLVTSSQAEALLKAGQHVAKGVSSLSDEEEYYLGRGVAATILSKYPPYQDPSVNDYLNKIAVLVAGVSERPQTFAGYHVQVIDSPEINAISAPGGFIFVSKGFLKIVPDEEALAAVLAHEVAHIVKGHGLKAISESNLSQALMLIGKEAAASQGGAITQQLTATFGDSVTDISNKLLSNGYSRSQEYEADEYAITLLAHAGYNPLGLHTMLSSIQKQGATGSGGWMSTHPEAADRIEELEDEKNSEGLAFGQELRSKRFALNIGNKIR